MLEAQKILRLSHMNNQTTKEHREENAHNAGLHIFFLRLYEHIGYLFIFTTI